MKPTRTAEDAALRQAARDAATAARDASEAKWPHPTRTPPWLGPLGTMDVGMACLYVAKLLERAGRHEEASYLRLDLGQKLIRAGLHEAEHPGPVTLGKEMARLVGAIGVTKGRPGDSSGDLTKKRRSKGG